jgi:hypothetical protein
VIDPTSDLALGLFNPLDNNQVADLIHLFHAYLTEEFQRIGRLPLGIPAAAWLTTGILWHRDIPIGFWSTDKTRYSLELIYLVPGARARGIATRIVADLAASCPRPMEIKAPLSPAGQHLADKLHLGVAHPTPEEEARVDQHITEGHKRLKANCRHRRRTGNPATPCARCYRRGLKRYATAMVMDYVTPVRLADGMVRGTVDPLTMAPVS